MWKNELFKIFTEIKNTINETQFHVYFPYKLSVGNKNFLQELSYRVNEESSTCRVYTSHNIINNVTTKVSWR